MLRKTFLILFLVPFILSAGVSRVDAVRAKPELLQQMIIEARPLDSRALVLRDYLAQFNSPLQTHTQDIIDAADEYDIDWKWIPAIAGVESTFGKFIPGGYNAWGWGVYGTQAIYFANWRDGIFTVTKGLKEGYIAKGLTNPYQINRMYAASPHWGGKVSYFLADIENYSRNYDFEESLTLEKSQAQTNTAAASAKLAFRVTSPDDGI